MNGITSAIASILVSLAFSSSLFTAVGAEATKASVESSGLAGRKTASGNPFNPNAMTAASKHYPLGSKLLVRNKKTGKSAVVKVNDRGPFVAGRGLDLSKKAARHCGVHGVAPVEIKPLHVVSKKHGSSSHGHHIASAKTHKIQVAYKRHHRA